MVSLRFLKRVVTLPYVIVRAVVQFYTTGTVYLRTNSEFAHSLYKNVHLAVEYHLANNFSRDDVARFVYEPVTKLFARFKTHPFAVGLNGYGDRIDDHAWWVVRSYHGAGQTAPQQKTAVLFLHGGGYCLNVFAAQFVGIMGVHHAVPPAQRQNLLIAVLDYSLTCHYKQYPTQIHEAMATYRNLVGAGYSRIILLGDSAGTNLACAMARYIGYPDEARAQFEQFSEFEWDFSPVPPPQNLIFVSPWLEPYNLPVPVPGVDTDGDLGAIDSQMGEWYVEGMDRAQLAPFVKFTGLDYQSHWAQVAAFNGEGRCLYIYGERENLRLAVEEFADEMKVAGANIDVHMEKGGIHDGLFYVESLDYLTWGGARTALRDGFAHKYSLQLVSQFLAEVI